MQILIFFIHLFNSSLKIKVSREIYPRQNVYYPRDRCLRFRGANVFPEGMNFLEKFEREKSGRADDRVPYSRFFHSRVMAIVSGVDRSTLFRGRAERTRAARSRFDSRADHAFEPIARTHSRFARVVARDQPHAHTSGMQMRAQFCSTVLRAWRAFACAAREGGWHPVPYPPVSLRSAFSNDRIGSTWDVSILIVNFWNLFKIFKFEKFNSCPFFADFSYKRSIHGGERRG